MNAEDRALLELLVKNEKALIDPVARKNPENLYGLLSPSFFEIGCSGKVWQRPETIRGLASIETPNIDATDFQLHRLSSDIVLLTFKTTRVDEKGDPTSVLRSSIWKKNEATWQMLFHQGTKVPR